MMHILQEPGLEHLPLCHPVLTQLACRSLNGGSISKKFTVSSLRHMLSASEADTRRLLLALHLPPWRSELGCDRLCDAVVGRLASVGAVLPPASDLACYALREDNVSCDVDVSPSRLVPRRWHDTMADEGFQDVIRTVPADVGPTGLVARGIDVGPEEARNASQDADVGAEADPRPRWQGRREGGRWWSEDRPFGLGELVVRVANLFRVYPSDGKSIAMAARARRHHAESLLERDADDVAAKIATSQVKAKAWVSMVVLEMQRGRTVTFREKWFGGAGSQSAADVRDRVMRTMNFLERELMDGLRFVYPANDAENSACGAKTVGYVWKRAPEDGAAYSETQAPQCDSVDEAFSKGCGVDGEGNLFVYLCRRWHDKLDDTSKISALVHEAAHHAGPGDITYNRDDMKALPQSEQLNNAASYQNFAEDVATSAWGCAQAESITDLPFECEPAPCRCPTFVSLCDDATWGAQIRKRCPATCGECIAPPDVAPAAATTTTTTTAASTTTTAERPPAPDCSEPDGAVNLNIGKRNWRRRNSCRTFSALGYCGYQEVEEACPVSCGACRKPAAKEVPQSCADDPTYSVATSLGRFTCENWRFYKCTEDAKQHCPTACGAEGCEP